MSNVKQVILIRKDLKANKGKIFSQVAHASMAWLTERINSYTEHQDELYNSFSLEEMEWMEGSFTKICLQVANEQELIEAYEKAKAAKLNAKLIIDEGRTCFNGVSTPTTCGVGPNKTEEIDKIFSGYKLY